MCVGSVFSYFQTLRPDHPVPGAPKEHFPSSSDAGTNDSLSDLFSRSPLHTVSVGRVGDYGDGGCEEGGVKGKGRERRGGKREEKEGKGREEEGKGKREGRGRGRAGKGKGREGKRERKKTEFRIAGAEVSD